MAQSLTTTTTTTTTDAVEAFLALRADWKAAGCPADHQYMVEAAQALAAPRPTFVEPLAFG